jgi:hypothetical protein
MNTKQRKDLDFEKIVIISYAIIIILIGFFQFINEFIG